jgi:hypothetical protein
LVLENEAAFPSKRREAFIQQQCEVFSPWSLSERLNQSTHINHTFYELYATAHRYG